MSKKEIDDVTGVETTGHEWDGIQELNNPMPRWWLWTFYATIVWSIGYMIAYPAWPLISTATTGVLGYSSRAEVKKELDAAEAAKADYRTAVSQKTAQEIFDDPNLRTFAISAGSAAFKVNCVQCHGSGATGSRGFPNLNDDEWLWGGSIADIQQTIDHGVRFAGDDETRISEMPAFKEMLKPEEISAVANYVASLTGLPAKQDLIASGKEVFAANCASCHGEDAKGMREVGAPDLTDHISLYAHSVAEIEQQVRQPQHGVMPAWKQRLGENMTKELAVYVYSLGGGK